MITPHEYCCKPSLVKDMTKEELEAAFKYIKGMKTESDLGYWQKISYLDDLTEHL